MTNESNSSKDNEDPLSPTATVHDLDGKTLSKAGITTEKSLDWLKEHPEPVLAPEPTPDDPDGWETARRNAEAKHKEQVEERRAAFRERAKDVKERFQMSNDYTTRRHQYDR